MLITFHPMLAPAQGPHVSHRLVGLLCCTSSSLLSDSLQADIPTILTHTNTGCSWPACHHYPACMKEKSGEVVNQTLRLMQNNEETKFSCENNQDPAFTNLQVIYLRWETLSDKNNACEYKGEYNNDRRAQLPLSAHGRRDGGRLVTVTPKGHQAARGRTDCIIVRKQGIVGARVTPLSPRESLATA